MDVFTSPQELTGHIWRIKRNYSLKLWEEDRSKPAYAEIIGFVPTMGALHEGHLSLVRRSVSDNHFTVVSIFVNPLQFGPNEDYEKYPKVFEEDCMKLESLGVDAVFNPDNAAFYPVNFQTRVHVKDVTNDFCGASRPGHFDGVTTVVAKLFGVVQPDVAYFGEKDYQQLVTIGRMVEDLNIPVRIIGMPTIRESDGLAMSSRNKFLTPIARDMATGLYSGLLEMRNRFDDGIDDSSRLIQIGMAEMMKRMGLADGFKIEYVEIVDPLTLKKREMEALKGDRILAAIRIDRTRLIDNIEI
jgi:pantoate--beta-alanine ligase